VAISERVGAVDTLDTISFWCFLRSITASTLDLVVWGGSEAGVAVVRSKRRCSSAKQPVAATYLSVGNEVPVLPLGTTPRLLPDSDSVL
jgi:hypothetical protein